MYANEFELKVARVDAGPEAVEEDEEMFSIPSPEEGAEGKAARCQADCARPTANVKERCKSDEKARLANYMNSIADEAIGNVGNPCCDSRARRKLCRTLRDIVFASSRDRKICCSNRECVYRECSTRTQDFDWRRLSPELFNFGHVCRERDVFEVITRDENFRESKMILETIDGQCIVSHRRHRESPRKSRTRWSTPLFIDQLKSDFQNTEFAPRVRTHRNWCPKFLSKYLNDNRDDCDEDSQKPLRRTLSRSFVPERPEIYSIGLRDRGSRSMDDNSGICNAIKNLRRCLNSVRRPHRPAACSENADSREKDARRKLDLTVRCSSFKENDHDQLNVEEPKCRKHRHRHCHRHRCSQSTNRVHPHKTSQHQDYSAEEPATKKTVAVQASRRRKHRQSRKNRVSEVETELRQKAGKVISNEEGFKLIETTRALYDSVQTKYLFNSLHELISDNYVVSKENIYCEDEKFVPAERTGSKYLTIAEPKSYTRMIDAKAAEVKVLEDIKKRIDEDFEFHPMSGRKGDDYEDFVISIPRDSAKDEQDIGQTSEIELRDPDFYYLNEEKEESEEFVSCRSSPYEISSAAQANIDDSKSLPVMPYTMSHYKVTKTQLRGSFSTNTVHVRPERNICDPKYLLLRHFCSLNSIPSEVSLTSPIQRRREVSEDKADKQLTRAAKKDTEYMSISRLRNIIDSTDSGVLTDCSPNELRDSETSVPKKADVKKVERHCSIYAREIDSLPVFDFNSDSCSDGSLERRVDRAVRTFTENLVFCERRARTKLKMLRKRRRAASKLASNLRVGRSDDFSRLSQWSSEDEKIPPLSTPSLSPFSDSEIENPTSCAATAREIV